ncbi:class I SAM-dependent RNA methyltransferase [Amycolatopsis viridis]|uniref:tRNA/tmRNA/rRNA uracil-C5-methylase (TrmA/RlmC/RlmD family) n=1 Tax=Amycolatopsis viridis TaxID=185678 RepID=A0ABX0SVD5_9PSEU|nr:class I SAM-dependent RNA methyltransferase [Amycolatopsis viridis]NIH79604.1 tRNA/tmRNA/rRNA uracil-C5-methylase (TrmA/RlmC/RlmD family) [Amycolatopsis viridis]
MSGPDWTGRVLELEVGPVAHGGHCVARAEGRVVFVRHALPGERVRAAVTEDKGGSFCRADAVEVLLAAPERVEPPCPLAVPGQCGGCDWQHAAPAFQRELKARVVAEQLQRLAGLDWAVEVEALPGGVLGWRSRVRLVAGPDGRAGLRAHRSHRVVAVGKCPIAVPGAVEQAVERRWRPGTEIEVTSDGDGRVHTRELATVRGKRRARQLTGGEAVQHAAGRDWRLQAHGFWQVHPAAADTFAAVVREWAAASPGALAWDLYAGVGLFASVLAGQVGATGHVVAVESGRRAVRDGERNLADLPQVSWRADRTERVLQSLSGQPEVVVLDPPRSGAGREVVEAVAAASPARVVYVACDPAALARDVAFFGAAGYRLERLRAFDAFPMTHHVECVALLEPAGKGA